MAPELSRVGSQANPREVRDYFRDDVSPGPTRGVNSPANPTSLLLSVGLTDCMITRRIQKVNTKSLSVGAS
jgi:hypothetical protein